MKTTTLTREKRALTMPKTSKRIFIEAFLSFGKAGNKQTKVQIIKKNSGNKNTHIKSTFFLANSLNSFIIHGPSLI
jgi:hypothetical protein